MFRVSLFNIRTFAAGNVASLMAALGRGGLMFILIIWLQGIWLPSHGYSFAQTPLWAGIFMLPLTVGFLMAGPVSGYMSDRFGPRPFAVAGMLAAAFSFGLLELLPINFSYIWFALLIYVNGLAMGLFASPNRAAVMNSLPPEQRGQGSGMGATIMNSAMVLSIGIFFTLIIIGLSADLPTTLYHGLTAHGVPAALGPQSGRPPAYFFGFQCLSGLQPGPEHAGSNRRPRSLAASPGRFPYGQILFPQADRSPVRARVARGAGLRSDGLPGGGGRISDAGEAVFLPGPRTAACGGKGGR